LHRAVAYVSWSVNIPTRLHLEPTTVGFNSRSLHSLQTMVHHPEDQAGRRIVLTLPL